MKVWIAFLAVLLLLCSGGTVLADNEGPMDEFGETYARGDVNGDGKVNAIDYALVKRFAMRKIELSDAQFEAADVNGDGKVNAMDYMIVKRVVMKLAEFPCRHNYEEQIVGNLHIFTCKSCGYQYERFDGELIG